MTHDEQMDELAQRWAEDDARDEHRVYRIIRFRFRGSKRTIRTGLTLAEAQAHCRRPDTSGTDRLGRFFDGYDYMRGFKPKRTT